ncbi:ATP-binding protein [Roseovarius sp. C7]|uniref:ATP-binding protein n=1 Tax=Roseovarius sp. C7 TaxID=3398643 RepID=UPI0039F6A704
MNLRPLFLFALLPLALLAALYAGSDRYFRAQEMARAEGRVSLYRSTVVDELDRFSYFTHVLARDPFVMAASMQGVAGTLDARLRDFAEQAKLDAIYLMGTDGTTIAASNAGQPSSFVGQNYAFRPYFRQAMEGGQGRFYGIGATTGLPGYFVADAVRDREGRIRGVIAIKLDLTRLEGAWRESGELVLLADAARVVILASPEAWRYRTLTPLSPEARRKIEAARQFTGQALAPLDWQQHEPGRTIIDGEGMIHLVRGDLPHGWTLHYLGSEAQIVTRSWLVVVIGAVMLGLLLLGWQWRRNQMIGAALRRSEAEEAALREANRRLAVEIEERRTAQRRLQRTQGELERASRLAALGQLAASVTHELGQPISAMRNHLAAAEISGQGGKMTGRLSGLVERMEGITRQLKFFAAPAAPEMDEVDLEAALSEALALVSPNLETAHVAVTRQPSAQPVWVRGNKLRLEQVLTNLLRNAVDAMEESETRSLVLSTGIAETMGWAEIADSGSGLGPGGLETLSEPFVTTRPSGQGMGLGLAISGGIVKEHEGRLTARDREGGGTVFRMEIPLAEES